MRRGGSGLLWCAAGLDWTRGRHRIHNQDRPKHTPLATQQLLCRADFAGEQVGALCRGMHRQTAVRRIQGVLSLAKN
jgi:hypothetical protein